ncbi:hypothetical protein [uncultured Fibrobacter sp.]|uniref:hypothetical protein n=1 Tax=uncultured Fibrobacter sp. TaxID=261512 RepID=UPI0025CECC00|nr:hypothetical protein [uncultured Fibrobacter sp.]
MVKKVVCLSLLMIFASCSSDSGESVRPASVEGPVSSDTKTVVSSSGESVSNSKGSASDSGAASNSSSETRNSSNGASVSSEKAPVSSAVGPENQEIKYQVVDVSSSPSDHENIASQEVQFIGDESISHTDVPLPKDVRYVNLNANEEYDYISFIEPSVSGRIDTVTLAVGGDCTLHGLCYIGTTHFVCYSKNDCRRCPNANTYYSPKITDKTLFINYGPNKISEAMPVYKVAPINSAAIRSAFAQLNYKKEDYISSQIRSNYQLEAKGLPEGMSFKDSPKIPQSSSSGNITLPFSSSSILYAMNACLDYSARYPEANMMVRTVSLYNASTESLKKDTTVIWTLVYTDQFGVSDSLSITTKFTAK